MGSRRDGRDVRRIAMIALAASLFATSIVSVAHYMGASAQAAPTPTEIVRVPPGCPGLPPARATPSAQQVAHVVPRETAPTAVDHVDPAMNLQAMLTDARKLLGGFAVISRFTLPSSGIELEIRSDGPITVDQAELDALARLPLEQHATFSDARVAALLGCYRERVMVERELEGTRLRIYVPSDHAACFRLGRISRVGDGAFAATCDASGVTLPGVPIKMKLLGMDVANLKNEATIIVSGAAVSVERAEERLSYFLLHEMIHHYDNSLGLRPWSESLSSYERRAYYVERTFRERFRDAGGLPVAVRYPSVASD